jgi:hypothetical protein
VARNGLLLELVAVRLQVVRWVGLGTASIPITTTGTAASTPENSCPAVTRAAARAWSPALVAAVLQFTACAVEPSTVVTESGPVSSAPETESSSFGVFRKRYEDLVKDQASPEKAFAVVEAGTQLEYQLCSSFFLTAGRQQQVLLFSKNLIAFLAATAAGALGAAHADPSAIAWIGLGGAGAVTAANIYARNFLFSEDNVEAVQSLTLRALALARDAALAVDRRSSYTFPSAISTIMDVQAICEVQHIINLSRDAIKNGITTVSTTEIASSLGSLAEISLGGAVKGNVPLNLSELVALYWVFRSPTPPLGTEQFKRAAADLAALTPPPLLPNGSVNPTFKKGQEVATILAGLPAAVTNQLQAAIQTELGRRSGGTNAISLSSQRSARLLRLEPTGFLPSTPGRISVGIQPLQ